MIETEWKKKAKPVLICLIAGVTSIETKMHLFVHSCRGRCSPLLWRVPIFLWSVAVTVFSIIFFWGPKPMFFLYMTHWGLLLIILESMFGIAVTLKKSYGGLPDATFGLPWYVKTYWVLYNVTVPVSFLVSVFYWGVLIPFSTVVNYAPNPVLDVMVHAVNSLVMLIELLCSAHPSRLLHVMQPLYFALVYLLFTVAYYAAGGVDPWGNTFIYPVINWSKPNQTMVVITLTAVFLALLHLLVVAIATARDAVARRYFRIDDCVYNEELKA